MGSKACTGARDLGLIAAAPVMMPENFHGELIKFGLSGCKNTSIACNTLLGGGCVEAFVCFHQHGG